MAISENVDPTADVDLEMPAEFADDPDVPAPYVPAASTYTSGSKSLDDLDSIGFNDARDEIERAKLNPPTGDWKKEDSWEFSKVVNTNDQQKGDLDPDGRTLFSFVGRPVSREANGLSYEPMFRLRISPDRREKQDELGKIDTPYKLYLKCKDMYLEKYSEKGSFTKLCNMLAHDQYFVRTMNGDNGPIIYDVKLKQYGGRNSK